MVLDHVPNDISVVQGIITQEFQTPLSHVNVLSQNRHNPNMGLRNATTRSASWRSMASGCGWWLGRRPTALLRSALPRLRRGGPVTSPAQVTLPPANLAVAALTDIERVTVEGTVSLRDAIKGRGLGVWWQGRALLVMVNTPGIPHPPRLCHSRLLLRSVHAPEWLLQTARCAGRRSQLPRQSGAARQSAAGAAGAMGRRRSMRDSKSAQGQDRCRVSRSQPALPQQHQQRRSGGFPCAGCYESHTGKAGDWQDMRDAIRDTWASAFLFRTYEERSYYSIEHKSVVMALLVTENFPTEEANGVALTNNPMTARACSRASTSMCKSRRRCRGCASAPGVTSDQYVYQFDQPSQPIVWVSHNNLLEEGQSVLSRAQNYELGECTVADSRALCSGVWTGGRQPRLVRHGCRVQVRWR